MISDVDSFDACSQFFNNSRSFMSKYARHRERKICMLSEPISVAYSAGNNSDLNLAHLRFI
jgi:hypothetical protein